MASSSEPLHLYPTRRATYHKSRKGASRSLNWPHPLTKAAASTSSIHADHLSRAGFYSTPTSDHPSSTTCFLCDLVVDGWSEGDEPVSLHLNRSPHCGWAILLSNMADDPNKIRKHWHWGIDGSDWPRSDKIHSARLMTFERGWPHNRAKGLPTVQQLASAGWWFRPEADEDAGDRCYCPYCTRTVEGWEAGDDAVALHQRKLGLECPFFLAERPSQLAAEDVAPVASAPTTKNTGLSRSKGRQKLAAEVNKELESESEELIEPIPSRSCRATKTPASIVAPTPTTERAAPPASKASTTRSTRSRKGKASTKHTPAAVEEDEREPAPEVEGANDSVIEIEVSHTMSPSVRLPPRKTRITKASCIVESEVKEEEPEVEAEEVIGDGAELDFVEDPVSTTPAVEEEAEEIAPPPVKKATKGKKGSKSKRSTKSKIVEPEPEVEVEPEAPEADEEIPEAVPEPIIIEEAEPEVPAVESAAEPEPAPDVDVAKTAPKPKTKKTKSKSSKSKSTAPQAPIVIAADPISPPRSATHSVRAAPLLPLPGLNTPFTPRPDNPFSLDAPLVPSLTPGARKLSLEAWYNHCGQTAYTALEQEMGHEMREFEKRIEDGNKLFEKMIEDAKRREAVVAQQQQQQQQHAQMQQSSVLGQAVRRMR